MITESMEFNCGQWGIEALPDLTVYAPGPAASERAGAMKKYSVIEGK